MGGKSSKEKINYILDVNWDITESPERNLFIKLPNDINGIDILCPINIKQPNNKLKVETIKLRANNTCNVISYMNIFKSIHNVYRHYRCQIIRYAEENNLPIELYFSKLKFVENSNKIGIYKLILTN